MRGDAAHPDVLQARLGKNGLLLFASGLDAAPVMPTTAEAAIKSIGNGTTTPRDIAAIEDARRVFCLLAESVGARLRENGFRSRCVSISVRTTELRCYSCQTTLPMPTCITSEIAALSCALFEARYTHLLPPRNVGLSCGTLSPDSAPIPLDMLGDQAKRERLERMDSAPDGILSRFGHQVIQRGWCWRTARLRASAPGMTTPSIPCRSSRGKTEQKRTQEYRPRRGRCGWISG